MARICTKFDTEIRNGVPEAVLPSKLTSDKLQDGGGRHFETHINGYNSAVFAYIYTKFDAISENDVPQEVLKSKFTSHEIQDGGGRHF